MCLKIVHSLVALEKQGLRYPDLCSDNILIRPSGVIKLGMHILTRSDIGLNRVTAFPEKWTPSSKVDHAGPLVALANVMVQLMEMHTLFSAQTVVQLQNPECWSLEARNFLQCAQVQPVAELQKVWQPKFHTLIH